MIEGVINKIIPFSSVDGLEIEQPSFYRDVILTVFIVITLKLFSFAQVVVGA